MKAPLALSLALLATLGTSQHYTSFRNCDPQDDFQVGVIEFDHAPVLQDSQKNEVFVVGHFLNPFYMGSLDYSLFLDGIRVDNGSDFQNNGTKFNYGSAESSFFLPQITSEGEYELLVKVVTQDQEQLGCAGLTFKV